MSGKIRYITCEADREMFCAYCGDTAVDLDPLPVTCARLAGVEPALFE